VVFGRRENGPLGPALHVVSLINTYASLVLNSPDDPIPQVGPISVRIPLSELGHVPLSVDSIDTTGLTWKIDDNTLHLEMTSIGHHAVIAIC